MEVDYGQACAIYLAKLSWETLFYPSFLPDHLIPVDLPLALMDDKSEKGKEKDGSASTPPNRHKVSIFSS